MADSFRTQLAQPELTHHITPDDFRRWWRETGSASPAPSPEMLLTANAWAQYCLDRWGRPTPRPLSDEEVGELVRRLKELAHAVTKESWREFDMRVPAEPLRDADLVLTRAAELLQRQHPQPVPVSERLPGATKWVWHCYAGVRFWQHGRYNGRQFFIGDGPESQPATHWLPAHALPLPTIEEFTS